MSNVRKITRRGPLNKSPGSFYGGVPTGQRVEAFEVLKRVVEDYKPEAIIEIGFWEGGMSLFLSDLDVCSVWSFDIKNSNYPVSNSNLNMIVKNCHSQETKIYLEQITKNKKTLWMIDGGDKAKEFNFLSDIIKTGELAMTHDFAPDKEGFNYLVDNNIWYWWESSLDQLDLSSFENHDDFEYIWKTSVWGAFVKQ